MPDLGMSADVTHRDLYYCHYCGSNDRSLVDDDGTALGSRDCTGCSHGGNGRIGRVLTNLQLAKLGYPPIIIRNKSKRTEYYPELVKYEEGGSYDGLADMLADSLKESLRKRLAYLRGDKIIKLADYAKKNSLAVNAQLNAAKRQTVPAFRERGVWKIGVRQ